MGNGLRNAGFLEETAGWVGSAQLTLSVDDTIHGAPGRHVLIATGVTTGAGQTLSIRTAEADRVTVTAGQPVEAFAGFAASHALSLEIEWFDVDGDPVGTTPLSVRGPQLATYGEGINGLAETFWRGYARVAAPAGAVEAGLALGVTPGSSGAAVTLLLLKPYLAPAGALVGEPTPWDPGLHEEAGLALPAWPSILKPFQAAPVVEPSATRTEFVGADGGAVTRRLVAQPFRRFKGRTRCDAVQRAALDGFFAAGHPRFWFTDPETQQLCIARWAAGGEPRAGDVRGVTTLMEVGLHLEVA